MQVIRSGYRYVDVDSGKTLDAWFPTVSNPRLRRSCLAARPGVVRGEWVEVAIRDLS
jgi:2,3,4,5-tetrahydropyridine-2-carboxylate N-succinyltransferase